MNFQWEYSQYAANYFGTQGVSHTSVSSITINLFNLSLYFVEKAGVLQFTIFPHFMGISVS